MLLKIPSYPCDFFSTFKYYFFKCVLCSILYGMLILCPVTSCRPVSKCFFFELSIENVARKVISNLSTCYGILNNQFSQIVHRDSNILGVGI